MSVRRYAQVQGLTALVLAALLTACTPALPDIERAWCEDGQDGAMARAARDQGRFDAFGAAFTEAVKRDQSLGDPDAWNWFYRQDVVAAACRAAYANRFDTTDRG